MRRTFIGMLLCLGVLVARLTAEDRIDLRVLYCGDHGSDREADFQSFLQHHFASVVVADSTAFKEEQAGKSDVVVFDWTNFFDGKGGIDQKKWDRMRNTPTPALSEKYARPTILIGARGGKIAGQLKLKTDWLCLCLDGPAHHLHLNHQIFHAPLEVNPEFEELPTADDYPFLTLDKPLGPKMKVWRVQRKDYPEINPGLVSDLYGFADSPDAEVIAQGVAGKGPDTLALGRQANFFLWGFSAPPADMTPSGQRLLVNVVSYMRKFDGQRPLVRKTARSREWALRYAAIPDLLSDFRQRRSRALHSGLTKHPDWLPIDRKGKLEEYVTETVESEFKAERGSMDYLLPESIRKEFAMDASKYVSYYKNNFEYVHPEGGDSMRFIVDEDAKSLGTSNRRAGSLDKWISLLERKVNSELALRLLKRYTQEQFDTADKWRLWLNKNRDHLFFSDVGGFKFFVAPAN